MSIKNCVMVAAIAAFATMPTFAWQATGSPPHRRKAN